MFVARKDRHPLPGQQAMHRKSQALVRDRAWRHTA